METTKTYNWQTPRGVSVEVEITTKHATEKHFDLMSDLRVITPNEHTVTTKCSEWLYTIDQVVINGKETEMHKETTVKGIHCIQIGARGSQKVVIAIPENVEQTIWGAEKAEIAERCENQMRQDTQYEAHTDMMHKAMEE